jgi:hypothetical protein
MGCFGDVMFEEWWIRQEQELVTATQLRLSLSFTSWVSYGPTLVQPGQCRIGVSSFG